MSERERVALRLLCPRGHKLVEVVDGNEGRQFRVFRRMPTEQREVRLDSGHTVTVGAAWAGDDHTEHRIIHSEHPAEWFVPPVLWPDCRCRVEADGVSLPKLQALVQGWGKAGTRRVMLGAYDLSP